MTTLSLIQALVAVILIGLILVQRRSAGTSGLLGGDGAGLYHARRGLERFVFWGTIVLAITFAALSLIQLSR
jgi:preprotein translocase subunit SecG